MYRVIAMLIFLSAVGYGFSVYMKSPQYKSMLAIHQEIVKSNERD